MRRRLRTAYVVLLLLGTASFVAMWLRSQRHYDAAAFWPIPSKRSAFGFISDSGTICVAKLTDGGSQGSHFSYRHDRAGQDVFRSRSGFVLERNQDGLFIGLP